MSRPLFRIEEEQGEPYCIYHFFAHFRVEESLLSLVKGIAGVDVVWQSLGENHFGVAFNHTFDAETIMFRLKAALTKYVKENALDQV